MVDSTIHDKVGTAGETLAHDDPAATAGSVRPATLADTLAAGLSEFFTRRRQNRRPGLYAPLVRLDRGE